ncbi:helix-turn-helix domain-containing protein, partial [Parabacteroides distasonis]|nr:helix-turn-helix domain-containing protein [Parabacteroides distasonis]
YASYEKGRRNPKQPIKEKIAKLLGCTMNDLNL